MVKTAFSTLSCPDWSWRDLLEKGTSYGYDGVEIRLLERETDLLKIREFRTGELAKRRAELSDVGFQVCGLASSVRFDYPDKSQRDTQLMIGKAYVDMARELGASFIRVFGDVLGENADDEQRQTVLGNVAGGLEELGEYAAEVGLNIFIETHGDFCETRLMQELMSLVENPVVGVLWDTHHPWRFHDEDVHETFARIGSRVGHTHWKDSVPSSDEPVAADAEQAAQIAHDLMSGHRHADYTLFGEGDFPALQCMQLLREAKYDGWFSLEWEKMWHPNIAEPEVAMPPFPEKIRRLWEATAG